MIRRKNKKVYLYTEVEPASLEAVLEIDIYDKICQIETSEGNSYNCHWEEYIDVIEEAIQHSIIEVNKKIINTKQVIYSYNQIDDGVNAEKNEQALQKNLDLKQYLINYTV